MSQDEGVSTDAAASLESEDTPWDSKQHSRLVQKYRFGRDDDPEKKGWPKGFQRNVDVRFPKYLPMKIVAKHPENQEQVEAFRRLLARCWIAKDLGLMPWEVVPESVPPQIDRFLESMGVLDGCFQIRMDGGAAEVFLPPFKVESAFSYLYEFAIQTEKLDGFVAGCELLLLQNEPKSGESLSSNIVKVVPSEFTTGDQDWQVIRIQPFQMEGVDATYGQLRFFVRPLERSGFSGTVRFDNVNVWKMPQLSMQLDHPLYLYRTNENVEVRCTASGLRSEIPSIELELVDHMETIVLKKQLRLDERIPERTRPMGSSGYLPVSAADASWKGQATWMLPKLDPGHYRLRCVLGKSSDYRFTDEINFSVLDKDSEGDRRFGWSLPFDQKPMGFHAIPPFLQSAGIRSVKIPIWYDPEDMKKGDEYAWLVERLKTIGVSTVGVLDLPPVQYRRKFGNTEMLISSLLEREDVWPNLLEPILSQLSMDIDTIQVGWDLDPSYTGHPQVDERLKALRGQLNLFRPSSRLVIPWSAIHEAPNCSNVNHYQYFVEPTWSPDELLRFIKLRERQQKPSAKSPSKIEEDEEWISIKPLNGKEYSVDQRLTHLADSMISVVQAKNTIGWISNPFDEDQDWMKSTVEPGMLFLPFRTLSMALNEHQFVGELALPNRSHNRILAKEDEGFLLLWNSKETFEETYLGEHVNAMDLFGKKVDVDNRRTEIGTVQRVAVSPYPILVSGVDMSVAQWRMGLSIENPLLETTRSRTQTLQIRFENPTRQSVVGKITVDAPDILQSASTHSIKLAPKSVSIIPIEVELRPNATAKKTKLQFDVQLQGNRPYAFTEFRDIQVGLSDIDLQIDQRIDEFGNLLLTVEILNRTGKLTNFECTLYLPTRSYERMFMKNVGDRMIKSMVIPDGRDFLNESLWMKCEEIESKRIVNQEIPIREE